MTRLFVLARYSESEANAAAVLESDPGLAVPLTPQGIAQARSLGEQVANLELELAVATRFRRTQETIEVALARRGVPLVVERGLDEVDVGDFDGGPIDAYWTWREHHAWTEPVPGGESRAEAVAKYAGALRRHLGETSNACSSDGLVRPAVRVGVICGRLVWGGEMRSSG